MKNAISSRLSEKITERVAMAMFDDAAREAMHPLDEAIWSFISRGK